MPLAEIVVLQALISSTWCGSCCRNMNGNEAYANNNLEDKVTAHRALANV